MIYNRLKRIAKLSKLYEIESAALAMLVLHTADTDMLLKKQAQKLFRIAKIKDACEKKGQV